MYVQEVLTLMFLRRTYTVFKSVFICKLKIGGRWESQIRGSLISVYIPSTFRGYFLPQISQIYTDYLSPTHIYIFEHETRRRPTDQREVISRISRIIPPPLSCSEANNKIRGIPCARNQFNQSYPYSKIKSVLIRGIRGRIINLWETK